MENQQSFTLRLLIFFVNLCPANHFLCLANRINGGFFVTLYRLLSGYLAKVVSGGNKQTPPSGKQ